MLPSLATGTGIIGCMIRVASDAHFQTIGNYDKCSCIVFKRGSTISFRSRLHYTIFIRRRYGNVPFRPTVYTVPFSYPASNEGYCIRKYMSVYTTPFSWDNISVPFSYENGIV